MLLYQIVKIQVKLFVRGFFNLTQIAFRAFEILGIHFSIHFFRPRCTNFSFTTDRKLNLNLCYLVSKTIQLFSLNSFELFDFGMETEVNFVEQKLLEQFFDNLLILEIYLFWNLVVFKVSFYGDIAHFNDRRLLLKSTFFSVNQNSFRKLFEMLNSIFKVSSFLKINLL